MKLMLAIAFAAAAFAQQEPAPLTRAEKKSIGSQLASRAELVKQVQAIQKQIQDIDRDTEDLVTDVYTARSIQAKDWNIKQDLSGWVKAVAAPAPVETKP